jgi:hypothetical protein
MLATTVTYRGLTLGGDPYRGRRLDGWEDLPQLDSGDEPRPARHGSWSGTPYAQSRVITLDGLIRAPRAQILDRIRDLRRVCAVPDDDTLYPLTATVLGETLTVDARVSQRIISIDRTTRLGHVPYVIQWTAPDPARYDPDVVHVVVPPGAARTAPQMGTTATRPVITVYGPCSDPTVTVTSGGHTRALGFTTELLDGETLVVDCDAGTSAYSWGPDASGDLATGSVPVEALTIPAGTATVALAAATASGDARAHLAYRHAYL